MVSQKQRLPNDLMLMVPEQVDDLPTLSKLTEACHSLLTPPLERRFDPLVPDLFEDLWPEELCQYTYAILLAEQEAPTSLQDLKTLFARLLEGPEPRVLPTALPWTLRTLEKIVSLKETIDFFVHFGTILFLQRFPLEDRTPLSTGEELRIRRAPLRFQLYTQLFHQPGSTDEIVSDRDWEQRHLSEQHFWTRFESVEAEECKCIYALLFNVLRYMHPICPANDQISDTQSVPPGSTERGLSLLKPIFSGGPLSLLMSSYAQSFVDYTFTFIGLEKADPFGGNFFLPYQDFRNWDRARERRYRPSEPYREANFGVKTIPMCYWPTKYHRVVKLEDRTGWRLIGYCFWDEERVDRLRKHLT